MNEIKFNRLINEFCVNGNLEEYRPLLIKICKEIFDAGCRISARYDSSECSHSKDPKSCRIMISLQPGLHKKPEHILWTILHEFGHHFSPLKLEDKKDIDKIIDSEEKAWDWAENRFNSITEFKSFNDDFLGIREKYLKTYYDERAKINTV